MYIYIYICIYIPIYIYVYIICEYINFVFSLCTVDGNRQERALSAVFVVVVSFIFLCIYSILIILSILFIIIYKVRV